MSSLSALNLLKFARCYKFRHIGLVTRRSLDPTQTPAEAFFSMFSQLIKAFLSLSANSSYSLSLFENKPRALIQVKKSLNCELDIDVKEHLGSPVKDCEHIRWDQMKKGGKWRKRKRS